MLSTTTASTWSLKSAGPNAEERRARELKREAREQFAADKLFDPKAMGAWVLKRYQEPAEALPPGLMDKFRGWIEALPLHISVHYTDDDHDPYELDHLICQGCGAPWEKTCSCPSRTWEPLGQYTDLRKMTQHVNQGFMVVPGRFRKNRFVGEAAGRFRAWHDTKHLGLDLNMDWLDELVLLRLTLERAPQELHGIIRAVSYYNTISEYGLSSGALPRDTPAAKRQFVLDQPAFWV